MTSIVVHSLNGNEQSPTGFPNTFPNAFDKASKAMIERLKDEYNYDLVNATLWKLIGLNGGPVRDFLMRYIKQAREWGKSYIKADWPQWQKTFISKYGYDDSTIEVYFRNFRVLQSEGRIPESIFKPWTYDPSKDYEGIGDKFLNEVSKYAKFALAGVAIFYGAKTFLAYKTIKRVKK